MKSRSPLSHLLVHRLVAPPVDAEQILGPATDLLAVLARDPQQVGDDRDREGIGKLADQLHAPVARGFAAGLRVALGPVEEIVDGLLDAGPHRLHAAAGETGLHQLADARVVGRVDGDDAARERPELLRRLVVLPLFRGQARTRIDREAVVEQRGHDIVVMGDEERLAVEEPIPGALRLLSVFVATELDPGDAALLAQRVVGLIGRGHELWVAQVQLDDFRSPTTGRRRLVPPRWFLAHSTSSRSP